MKTGADFKWHFCKSLRNRFWDAAKHNSVQFLLSAECCLLDTYALKWLYSRSAPKWLRRNYVTAIKIMDEMWSVYLFSRVTFYVIIIKLKAIGEKVQWQAGYSMSSTRMMLINSLGGSENERKQEPAARQTGTTRRK